MATLFSTGRRIQAALACAAVHFGLAVLLWQGGRFEHGIARAEATVQKTHKEPGTLEVTLTRHTEHPPVAPAMVPAAPPTRRTPLASPAVATPEPSIEQNQPSHPVVGSIRQPTEETIFGHFPEGRLTKQPVPQADIDLDLPTINGTAFTGTADMTVLIDATGVVLDVIIASETDSANAFADMVAARFRQARFIPGEIDGMPVKSALRVTVVSEPLVGTPTK